MGINPGPNGYELGDPCPVCEGAKTPKRMLCIVGGVSACPPGTGSPNDIYVLTQTGPCSWGGSNDLFDVAYNAFLILPENGAGIQIVDMFLNSWFAAFVPSFCAKSFINGQEITDCGGITHGYGGFAMLLFGPGI